ncbi:LamG-like jellyroll fold domain-containing protein [Kitasatospora sp. NPDC052896]|uniref:LamG-like jellyroll fold domain-containing protein n=1 Tax=Kitasatospora sp. NPDC052896 TaxID=3364061 RepID=UPI0037C9802A
MAAPPTPAQPKNLTPMQGGEGSTVAEQEAMAAAAAQAHAAGRPVVVDALTTETQQVVAQPKGGFALTGNPEPVRTKMSGSWRPVDTSLRRNGNGGLSPVATAYGSVSFSDGGNGPLVVTSSGDSRYSVSWPGALPVPAVSGNSATYAEVLPGADLVLSATASGGFSDVLVVKNAQAAKNPALASLKLATQMVGGKVADSKAQGGVSITGGAGGAVLESGTPVMWDSNTTPLPGSASPSSRSAKAGAEVTPDASDAAHPGVAARIALVGAKASATSLTLTPDAKFLTDPSTVFPAFIDPTFNWHPASSNSPAFDEVKQGSPCNGVSLYDNTGSAGDGGQLGVGVNGWSSCQGIMRTYYQWQLPTLIWGADIQSATVDATKVYSASCGTTQTVNLHWAGGIGSGTSWNNQPGYGGSISSANFGPACNGSVSNGLSVTGPITQAASGHWGQFTAALTDDNDEASHSDLGFSRFSDNPTLQIFYNQHPNTPGTSDLSAVTGADNAGCATTTPYPLIGKTIASNTPVLRAHVSDPDGDALQASFKYWVDGSSTSATGQSGDNQANGSTATYSLPSSFISSLSNGQSVDWQVQVTDGEAWSGWSPTCHFSAEPNGPNNPTTQPNTTYPSTDTPGAPTGAAAGTSAPFTIDGSTDGSGAPATKIIYGLDQQPATSNTPANQTATVTGSAVSAPVGRWQMNEGNGNTSTDSSGNGHTVTYQGGASWNNDPTRGTTVAFDGSTGYGATTAPVLTTNTSFTVSAWVKPSSLANGFALVSQSGSNSSNFQIYYSSWAHAWAFGLNSADVTTNSLTAIYGPTTGVNSPTVGNWANVLGVYNAATQQMQLYVNGTLAASGSFTATPWNATGDLQIGRSISSGSYTSYANSLISDIQTYPRALTAAEVNTVGASAAVNITPPSPGPHTLWTAAVDAAGDLSAMSAYHFLAAAHANTTCASLAACFDNTAISPDSNMGLGAADGNASFSATDLTNAGWNPGGTVTIDGATFTLPTFGNGKNDNVLAANQTITMNPQAPASSGSALMFLATSTNTNLADPGSVTNAAAPYVPTGTAVSGTYCFDSTNPSAYCPAKGTITYTDGTTQYYYLLTPDWITGPASLAAVGLTHWNKPSGQISNAAESPKIYPFSVPLTPGKTIASVTLPDVSSQPTTQGLHIFGLSTRNTTTGTAETNGTTTPAPNGQTWTGAWGSPTEGVYSIGQTNGNQTVRIELQPSISGNTLRIKLDDALATNPLVIAHATVAVASAFDNPVPSGTTTDLKFGGNAGVTVPQGGMVYSDPLAFTVSANQYLLVSFDFTNPMSYMPMNPWSNSAFSFLSPPGSGDHSADTSNTAFTGTGAVWSASYTEFLTDLDVTTNSIPTQAVLGDGMIDPGQPGTTPVNATTADHLAADLASAEPSVPNPYGTVDEGIEANQIMKDYPESTNLGTGGPSALSRIDRDILDQPGLNTVVLDEGLEDVLNGQTSDNLTSNGYTQLLTYFQASDINVIAVGLTPCDGYAGDKATGSGTNDPCTSTVDKYRTTVNQWLSGGYPLNMGPWSTPALSYIDSDQTLGIPDTTNGEIKLNPSAAVSTDQVNLTTDGYAALASAMLGAQDTWPLDDGNSSTTAADTASSTGNAYLAANPAVGQNPATLNGGATWTTDPTRGTVLNPNGTSGYAATSGPVVNTTGSFTVSAWVNFSSTPTANATVLAQNGTQGSSFSLQYNASQKEWCLDFTSSDTANATTVGTPACMAMANDFIPGYWSNIVISYNASDQTAKLYPDGCSMYPLQFNVTPWAASGSFTIGSGLVNGAQTGFFPGTVSDVQVWNYALSDPQVFAVAAQVTPIH